MKKYIIILAMLTCSFAYSQNTFKAIIKDGKTNELLVGATAQLINTQKEAIANEKGYLEIQNIPNGMQQIQFSHLNYEIKIDSFTFPISDTLQISLEEKQTTNLDEVVIQTTRTSRTIKNTPTRIETIATEELDEKSNMKSANISMVLQESTGIQVQQTSATSGNASIRVQGLDGRYTQLLKDGYPNFGNFASGLSILEIPPLDLKQVEVIKGSASTLYGGGAIAGVINFVSKTPKEKAENNIILSQSHIGQSSIGAFSSQRKGKLGYTVLGLVSHQLAYDVDKDGFSELPKAVNFTINPRLFYYLNPSTTFMLGNSFSNGNMKGGDMKVIKNNTDVNHTYFEENKTLRNTTTFEFDKKFENKNSLKLKQSLSFFDRTISIPNYTFSGLNTNAFTDASYLWNKEKNTIIGGLNLIYDNFNQKNVSTLDAKSFTAGVYIQHTWDISDKVKLENGLRIDNVNYSNINFFKNQTFFLPKISALFKIDNNWSSRISCGLGYKIPTIFTEKTETFQYQNLSALNNVEAEKSIGGTADVNYRGGFTDDLSFSINQMFFITQLNKPLVLEKIETNYSFLNANKPILSNGFETNIKFVYKENLKLFIGYTFTNANAKYLTDNQFLPLVPKNKLNLILVYEKEDNFKIGLEGYFTDKQYLYNGTPTPTFWKFGLMGQKTMWERYNFFMNFENLTDTRQSRYKPVVNLPYNNPTFNDIWTYTDGFVFNFGVKIKL